MRSLALFLLYNLAAALSPPDYDARALRPECRAWREVLSQGNASSCCAAAMATALSLRECMRDGNNVMYSAQQIWDCSGTSISSAERGTMLQRLLDDMMRSGKHYLVSSECAPFLLTEEPSLARCEDTCQDEMTRPISTTSTFQLSVSATVQGHDVSAAMKDEILQNGPLIAVLEFGSLSDVLAFDVLRAGAVFTPTLTTAPVGHHCIVVYGWGADGYWLVQNSYGSTWADHGVGRIKFGTLERSWRGVSTPAKACNAPCALPPILPHSDIFGYLSDMIYKLMGEGGNVTMSGLNVTKISTYYRDTVVMHYHTVSALPNSTIVCLTIASSIFVVWLLYMITPAAPVPARYIYVPVSYHYK